MSVQSAIAFIKKVNDDTDLQATIKGLNSGDLNALLNIAAESGFKFNLEDWSTAMSSSSAELSEEDLNRVAGGVGDPTGLKFSVSPLLEPFRPNPTGDGTFYVKY